MMSTNPDADPTTERYPVKRVPVKEARTRTKPQSVSWRTFDPSSIDGDDLLSEELLTYKTHLDELLEHKGQYVLIKGPEVVELLRKPGRGLGSRGGAFRRRPGLDQTGGREGADSSRRGSGGLMPIHAAEHHSPVRPGWVERRDGLCNPRSRRAAPQRRERLGRHRRQPHGDRPWSHRRPRASTCRQGCIQTPRRKQGLEADVCPPSLFRARFRRPLVAAQGTMVRRRGGGRRPGHAGR